MTFMSRLASVCIFLLLTASAALAQALPPAPLVAPAPSWGITDETAVNVSSFDMLPYADGVVINTVFGTALRYVSSAPSNKQAILPLDLPRGAIITRFEVEACNDDTTTPAVVEMHYYGNPPLTFLSSAPIPVAVGCGTFSSSAFEHTVGIGGPYGLLWSQFVLGPTQRISLVRVYYKLQVSPAPLTATFGDVPVGNPLHQYVEALVAAGITAGCGEGNYCPGASITRGQMAVFLAKALGLHWAP